QAWSLHVDNESRLTGVPQLALDHAREEAKLRDLDGWVFTLDIPSYRAILSNADDRELRAEMYQARTTRASDQGPHDPKWDNTDLILEILKLRQEAAQLLGYPNYVEMSLAKKMAPDADTVMNFLQELIDKAKPVAQRELDDLQAFAQPDLGEPLQAWDIGYYAEKLKEQRLQFDDEALRPYFQLDKVMATMFDIAEKLFGVSISETEPVNRWHDDVKLYRVVDEQNNERGQFYVDLYTRKKKRGGAWMDSCFGRIDIGDQKQQPITYLNCNFMPANEGKPALLTHGDVETLFHEFGHNLHGLLTKVDYPSIAGTNGVAWDAVELPSQFMENFIWQPEVLRQMSSHYETGEPLPEDKIEGLLKSRVFHSGMHVTRQLSFGWLDLQLHLNSIDNDSLNQIVHDSITNTSVTPVPDFNRFANAFNHIFEGGYAAGYYSYLWADVLAADAYSAFQENGLLDKDTGRKFLHEILEVGGSREAMDAFKAFRGREPKPDALLRQLALVDAADDSTIGI
ncbi:MAG: M3 family metallopeptidase, partial [Gammaproteobacteria bacterium]|nr:M3 family metallopeptidase [Gammaproteobacteria bacterium]